MAIQISVNGQTCSTSDGQTVLGLLAELNLDPERVAVELNRSIVKKPLWETTPVEAGAQLEIVQFVGGG